MYKYEKEFREENPQTIGETDQQFDLDNYKDWLEKKLEVVDEKNRLIRKWVNIMYEHKINDRENLIFIKEIIIDMLKNKRRCKWKK